ASSSSATASGRPRPSPTVPCATAEPNMNHCGNPTTSADNEFPPHAAAWPELTDPARELSRRRFLQLMGASLALAGVTGGCSDRPDDLIVPYVDAPAQMIPGMPLVFATAMP